MADFSLVSV